MVVYVHASMETLRRTEGSEMRENSDKRTQKDKCRNRREHTHNDMAAKKRREKRDTWLQW